jgi:hypothetical protein
LKTTRSDRRGHRLSHDPCTSTNPNRYTTELVDS